MDEVKSEARWRNGAATTFRNLKCIFLKYAAIFMVIFSIPNSRRPNTLDNIYILNNADCHGKWYKRPCVLKLYLVNLGSAVSFDLVNYKEGRIRKKGHRYCKFSQWYVEKANGTTRFMHRAVSVLINIIESSRGINVVRRQR